MSSLNLESGIYLCAGAFALYLISQNCDRLITPYFFIYLLCTHCIAQNFTAFLIVMCVVMVYSKAEALKAVTRIKQLKDLGIYTL